jgi:alanine racemase
MGVVKADAYGHGAVEVSRILTAEGAEWLAVSSVPEGVALRRAGIQARILVMTGFLPYESQNLVAFNLTPAVHSLSEVAELDRLAHESGRTVDYHLKIDSGRTGWVRGRAPPRSLELCVPPHTLISTA